MSNPSDSINFLFPLLNTSFPFWQALSQSLKFLIPYLISFLDKKPSFLMPGRLSARLGRNEDKTELAEILLGSSNAPLQILSICSISRLL